MRWLSIDTEGYEVARALAMEGICAGVLTYRLQATPRDEDQFRAESLEWLEQLFCKAPRRDGSEVSHPWQSSEPNKNVAVRDGLFAMGRFRAESEKWGIASDRIGFLGFSAGAAVAHGVAQHCRPGNRPNFVAQLYMGAASDVLWRRDSPPHFLGVAADDQLAAGSVIDAAQSRIAQGLEVELHVYQNGGHGFGMTPQGRASDKWYSDFSIWVKSLGF
jgi:dienelactone hydrolase